jgi:hypothetical protein
MHPAGIIPSIQIIPLPAASEDYVLYGHDHDVDDGPVADDAEEGLECVFKVLGCTAADY